MERSRQKSDRNGTGTHLCSQQPYFCPMLLCTITMEQWLQFPLNNWLSAAHDRQEGMQTAKDAPVPDQGMQPMCSTSLHPLSHSRKSFAYQQEHPHLRNERVIRAASKRTCGREFPLQLAPVSQPAITLSCPGWHHPPRHHSKGLTRAERGNTRRGQRSRDGEHMLNIKNTIVV